MGAAAIPAIALVVVIGLIVCLCMGELAALLPHRTGGMPSYAYESFEPLGHTTAKHIGGVSGWGYWLGWFPVAPINMLLAAGYIAVLFHVPLGRSFSPLGSLGTPVSMGVLVITFVGLIGLFIPCYLGIRLGATLRHHPWVSPLWCPSRCWSSCRCSSRRTFHWSNISGFHFAEPKTAGAVFFLAWIFVISWNAIAMEAAACYIGECRDPARDAKIALTAEGLYGVFIYIATAVVFVGVLGASLKTADPLTLYTSFADHIFGNAGWVKYLIGIPLIFALCSRCSTPSWAWPARCSRPLRTGCCPKFFEHKNKHHVPDRAMAFNVACALVVGLFGSPVRIYIFSNVGYIVAVAASLYGYFLLRQFRPEKVSPFRMPGWFRWVALAVALFLTFDYFVGGWNSPDIVVGPGQGHFLYLLGLVVVAAYVPLYWWRKMTDKRQGMAPSDELPIVVGSPGGVDFGGMPEPTVVVRGDESHRCQPWERRSCDDGAERPRGRRQVAPVRRKFGRRKFDKQPDQQCCRADRREWSGHPGAAVRSALRLERGRPVAVVTIARILRLVLGLPNPGLMPTSKEMDGTARVVERAGPRSKRAGWRPGARSPPPAASQDHRCQAAEARGVDHVIVVRPEQPVRWRQVVEGDLVKEVARKARLRCRSRGRQPRERPYPNPHRRKEKHQLSTSACSGSGSRAPTPTTSSAQFSATSATTS